MLVKDELDKIFTTAGPYIKDIKRVDKLVREFVFDLVSRGDKVEWVLSDVRVNSNDKSVRIHLKVNHDIKGLYKRRHHTCYGIEEFQAVLYDGSMYVKGELETFKEWGITINCPKHKLDQYTFLGGAYQAIVDSVQVKSSD